METKILSVNKNKNGNGDIAARMIIPSKWWKVLEIEDKVTATFDGEKIIITKEK